MMQNLIEATLAFALSGTLLVVGLLWTEAIVKPLITFFAQRQIRRYLPLVLDRLDPVMPGWIARYTEQELRELVINEIFSVGLEMGEPMTDDKAENILKQAVTSYSFLTNAGKNNGPSPS